MPIDIIVEVNKADSIVEVEKFNPYHDARGRFASAGSGGKFFATPGKSKAHDNAIAREKERQAAAGGAKEENSGKYAGRFKDGTDEQLRTAERNLKNWIDREKDSIAANPYVDRSRRKEHLEHHETSLKELQAQQKELYREMDRRGMKPNAK